MNDPGRADVLPAYGGGSLADVLPSVLTALGAPPLDNGAAEAGPGGAVPVDDGPVDDGPIDSLGLGALLAQVRAVLVLLIDGLGHHQLPLMAAHAPTLASLAEGRLVGQLVACGAQAITTGFPSTTPTSLVSLGTGAAPGRHGIVGFTVNVPGTDRVLVHIHWWDDPDPLTWQPLTTQLNRASAAGIRATTVGRPEFAGSGLTTAAYRGGRYVGAPGVDRFVRAVRAGMRVGATGRALVVGYLADLDAAGHAHGVGSPQWCIAATLIDGVVSRIIETMPPDTALVITADHGQLNVPADHRFDIATDARLSDGIAVVAGEPRVRYLHTLPGARQDVRALWQEVLGDAATVLDRDEAVAQGWFGPVPATHLSRIGDLVVICHSDYAIMSTGTEGPSVASLVALHGSATEAEMRIPLLVAIR